MYNDNSLVIDNIKVNFLKILLYILTSQYSSKEYLQLIERLNGKYQCQELGSLAIEIETFLST
ncbi:hypothetical protein HYD61_02555 [Mycoplasmopsis bovis]|nr:hypothetical protein [Mycoplasmopsis bovis]QQH60608.1 hypothetical protein HYD61_02555 [Mycoplasmopsis bovis]